MAVFINNGCDIQMEPFNQAEVEEALRAHKAENANKMKIADDDRLDLVCVSPWSLRSSAELSKKTTSLPVKRRLFEPLKPSTTTNQPAETENVIDSAAVSIDIAPNEKPTVTTKGHTRNKKSNVTKWKRSISKLSRMRGEIYQGFASVFDKTSGKWKPSGEKMRPAKTMAMTCSSAKCAKSSTRFCGQFTEAGRQDLFNVFWKTMDWGQKESFVKSMVDESVPKSGMNSKRTKTRAFFLKLEGRKRQVCKTMFLNTMGISDMQLRVFLKGRRQKSSKKHLATKRNSSEGTAYLKKFLLSLPKLESHYCRKSTSKLYLETFFSSKRQVYRVYKKKCEDESRRAMSIWKFWTVLDELNIGLYQPKKDQCDMCVSFQAGNVSEVLYQAHILNKTTAREEKAKDKEAALEGKYHMICMDVQAVKLAPCLQASALYYKTKLCVHNFTILDLASLNAKCYLWDETEGELRSSTFATCLIDFLETHYEDNLPIIIYSDGCTSQNRNTMMATALLDYAMRKNKVVTQKILEKGHTQMEVDSMHSTIERQLKGKKIYVPKDYIQICSSARIHPRPYEVKYMNHKMFSDYSKPAYQRYRSIRPGTKVGDPTTTDIRQLKYSPDGLIEYKLDYSSEWKPLPNAPKTAKCSTFPMLYMNRLLINKRKYDDLQSLKHVIPEVYHKYYDTLPTGSK